MLFVYVYFTDGLQKWAECYLQSFKHYNGGAIPIVAETRNLSPESIDHLKGLYPNLELRNRPLDMAAFAELSKVPIDVLHRWKSEVEHQVTTDENFPWKLLISVEERYRSLESILSEFTQRGFTRMLHTDIDVYYRRGLGQLDELISENDVCLYFRRKSSLLGRRKGKVGGIWGGMLGVNATEGGKAFLDDWKARIERVPCPNRPRGFGQHTLLESYLGAASQLRWGDLAHDPKSLSVAKTDNANPEWTPNADIWIGNSNKGRNRKDISMEFFLEDFRRLSGQSKAGGSKVWSQ